jgi:hypothetical protein
MTGETAADPPVRHLRVRPIREAKIVLTQYLWTGYVPADQLMLVIGKPGLGKSTLVTDLAAKITTGQLDGDFKGEQHRVLYSVTEDSESTFKARFVAAGGDVDYLHLVDVVYGNSDDGSPLLVTLDMEALREAIQTWEPVLVVLDALNSSLAGQLNDNSNVRPQLEKLRSLAHQTGTTILGVGHFRKNTLDVSPVDAIGGAGAYGQVCRHVLACAADDEKTSVLSLLKSNVTSLPSVPSQAYRTESVLVETDEGGNADVGRIVWLGATSTSVVDLLQRSPYGDSDERTEAARWLTEYLTSKGGGAPVAEVIDEGNQAGFSKDVLKRAKSKANARSEKSDFGGGWVWRIRTPGPEECHQEREGSSTAGLAPFASLVLPSPGE